MRTLLPVHDEIAFRETGGSIVTGTVIEVNAEDRRYLVDWHDGYRITELCADSDAIVSAIENC